MRNLSNGPLLSSSYGSWICNYLCKQCLSPLTLWVRIPFRRGVLDTALCDKVCQLVAAYRWLSPGTPVSSTNKADSNDIAEILLKVALNIMTVTLTLESYLPDHMSSPSVFSLGSISSILSFLVVVCQPLFVLFRLIIVLSVIFIKQIILLKFNNLKWRKHKMNVVHSRLLHQCNLFLCQLSAAWALCPHYTAMVDNNHF